jgi:hypothetical protein
MSNQQASVVACLRRQQLGQARWTLSATPPRAAARFAADAYGEMHETLGALEGIATGAAPPPAAGAPLRTLATLLKDSESRRFGPATAGLVAAGAAPVLCALIRVLAEAPPPPGPRPRDPLRLALLCLRELCFAAPQLSNSIAETFIAYVFSLMRDPAIIDMAVALLEEILAVRVKTFNLALVPDLGPLLLSLHMVSLSDACRVLALVVFEPERHDGRPMPAAVQLELAATAALEFGALDRNHAIVTRVPGLLRRLVRVIEVANTAPESSHALSALMESFGHDLNAFMTPEMLQLLVGSRPEAEQWGACECVRGRAAALRNAAQRSAAQRACPRHDVHDMYRR